MNRSDLCGELGPTLCIFVNGTVGVGKTTTAKAIGDILRERGISRVVVDLDGLRGDVPAPDGDPFNHELELRNLAAMAGATPITEVQVIVLAGVVEVAGEVERYRQAVRASKIVVARLVNAGDVIAQRLRVRHAGDVAGLEWHLTRSPELSKILDDANLDNFSVDGGEKTPSEIAIEILGRIRASCGL